MKKMIYPIVGILLGLAVGLGWYLVETNFTEESFVPYQPVAPEQSNKIVEGPAKKPSIFVANGKTHNFGSMKISGVYEHEFIVKNQGQAPLEIRLGKIDGDGVSVNIKTDQAITIEPNRTHAVAVSCSPASESPDFEGFVQLLTNDPSNKELTLTVLGKID